MPGWLIILLVFVAFFLWAGYKLRGRAGGSMEVRDQRDRTTRGGDAMGPG